VCETCLLLSSDGTKPSLRTPAPCQRAVGADVGLPSHLNSRQFGRENGKLPALQHIAVIPVPLSVYGIYRNRLSMEEQLPLGFPELAEYGQWSTPFHRFGISRRWDRPSTRRHPHKYHLRREFVLPSLACPLPA
jgi:hypothetical protein